MYDIVKLSIRIYKGIEHGCVCVNICWVPRELNRSLKGRCKCIRKSFLFFFKFGALVNMKSDLPPPPPTLCSVSPTPMIQWCYTWLKICKRLADWPQKYSSFNVWTTDNDWRTTDLLYYKLNLWAFGSDGIKSARYANNSHVLTGANLCFNKAHLLLIYGFTVSLISISGPSTSPSGRRC